MITNHLLQEKHKTQKRLSEEAQYDVHKYAEKMHNVTLDVQERYGIKFKYREEGLSGPLSDFGALEVA